LAGSARKKAVLGGIAIETFLLIAVVLALAAAAAAGVHGGLFCADGEAIPVPVPYEVFGILDAPERQPDSDAARPRYPVELIPQRRFQVLFAVF